MSLTAGGGLCYTETKSDQDCSLPRDAFFKRPRACNLQTTITFCTSSAVHARRVINLASLGRTCEARDFVSGARWLKGCYMATSRLQEATKERIKEILNGFEIFENYRPDWLRNPETGKKLELDFYIPEARVAIEVQGEQHFEYIPGFHANEDEFHRMQARDQIKRVVCRDKDISLYEICGMDEIEQFISDVIKSNRKFGEVLRDKNTALKTVEFCKAEYIREMSKPLKDRRQSKLDKLTRQMVRIIQKHNLDPHKINADYEIRKNEIQYAGKRKVWMTRLDYGKRKAGVLINVKDGLCLVRRFAGPDKSKDLDYVFNMETGEQVGDFQNYQLDLESLKSDEVWGWSTT